MPRKPSTDLFLLVKSFSANEWETFWRIQHQNQWQQKKDSKELPLVYRFILEIKEMGQYDEALIKEKLEVQPGSQRLKKLKIRAEELVQEIFERTPENITTRTFLQKLPVLLDHYLERGAVERAEVMAKKYVVEARKRELFEIESQLLTILEEIQARASGGHLSNNMLEVVKRRIELTNITNEVGKFHSMREHLRVLMKAPQVDKEKGIAELVEKEELGNEGLVSVKAKVFQADVNRVLAIRKGDFESCLMAVNLIKRLGNDHPLVFENHSLFQILVQAVSMGAFVAISLKKFPLSGSYIKELEAMNGNLETSRLMVVKENILKSSLLHSRYQLDVDGTKSQLTGGWKHYKKLGFPITKNSCFYFAFLSAEASFVIRDFSKTMRWASLLTTKSPSLIQPDLTSIAFVIGLATRFLQRDIESAEYLYRQAQTFFKKHEAGNLFLESVLNVFKKWIKSGGTSHDAFIIGLDSSINLAIQNRDYAKYLDYFPFKSFVESLKNKIPLLDQMRSSG